MSDADRGDGASEWLVEEPLSKAYDHLGESFLRGELAVEERATVPAADQPRHDGGRRCGGAGSEGGTSLDGHGHLRIAPWRYLDG